LSYIIRRTGEKKPPDNLLDIDDFKALLSRKEFKDLVVGELYEAYFLPERHESDWQMLQEFVAVVTSEPFKEFIALAIVSGVVGRVTYDVLRIVVTWMIAEMRGAKFPLNRLQPFQEIENDIKIVEKYFRENKCERIGEIEKNTGIPREKLYPLLKLLGFKHYRRQYACYWCEPGATIPNHKLSM
jgi:hypothetical protein